MRRGTVPRRRAVFLAIARFRRRDNAGRHHDGPSSHSRQGVSDVASIPTSGLRRRRRHGVRPRPARIGGKRADVRADGSGHRRNRDPRFSVGTRRSRPARRAPSRRPLRPRGEGPGDPGPCHAPAQCRHRTDPSQRPERAGRERRAIGFPFVVALHRRRLRCPTGCARDQCYAHFDRGVARRRGSNQRQHIAGDGGASR